MLSRISGVLLLIFFIAVIASWYQGLRLYPYAFNRMQLESQISLPERKIELASVRKIKNLELDFSIFEDPLYRSLRLRDIFIPEVSSIPSGKTNPFAGAPKVQSKVKPTVNAPVETQATENKIEENKTNKIENKIEESKIIQP